jgi:hypothetical protein
MVYGCPVRLSGDASGQDGTTGQQKTGHRCRQWGILIAGFVAKPVAASPLPYLFKRILSFFQRFLMHNTSEDCKPSLNVFVVQIYFLLQYWFRRET